MNNKKIIFILLLIWPFLYLLPLSSGFIAMGNDFDLVYYSYKKYIFELLNEGYLPLWSPYEGAGYSLIYNPFASYFYIPSWINFLLLKIKGTFSLQDYLLYTISGLSIFNLGLYLWLKRFKIEKIERLFVVLIISSSLLITGFLRFPNAIHSLAWFPYILIGVDIALKQKFLKSFFIIFISYLFLITAGYPYFLIYFSLFIFFYFFFTFFYEKFFYQDNKINIFKYALKLAPSFILAIFIASPWLMGVKNILNLTTDRNISNYEFATLNEFNLVDIIGSWIYPLASNTDGRYYLGLVFSLLILSYLITVFFYRKVDNKEVYLTSSCVFFFIFVSLIAAGEKSFLFNYFWSNVEFFQQFRTWPRINILLIPVFALLLSLSLRHLLRTNFLMKDLNPKIVNFNIIFLILSIILIIQFFLFNNNIESGYWETWHQKRFAFASNYLGFPFNKILDLFNGIIHIISTFTLIIIFIIIIKNSNFFLKSKKTFLGILILFSSLELILISNLQWSLLDWKTKDTNKIFNIKEKIIQSNFKSREFHYVFGNEFVRSNVYQINNFANWGLEGHEKVIRRYYKINGSLVDNVNENNIKNFKYFFGIDNQNKRVFLTKNIDYSDLNNFVGDNRSFEINNNLEVDWSNYFGNEIIIKVELYEPGWLTFVDNYDPFWEAYINDRPTKLHKFLDTYKSVKLDKGMNIVKFKYSPFNISKIYFN